MGMGWCPLCGIVKLSGGWHSRHMTSQTPNYHGYRFPPEIISHAV